MICIITNEGPESRGEGQALRKWRTRFKRGVAGIKDQNEVKVSRWFLRRNSLYIQMSSHTSPRLPRDC